MTDNEDDGEVGNRRDVDEGVQPACRASCSRVRQERNAVGGATKTRQVISAIVSWPSRETQTMHSERKGPTSVCLLPTADSYLPDSKLLNALLSRDPAYNFAFASSFAILITLRISHSTFARIGHSRLPDVSTSTNHLHALDASSQTVLIARLGFEQGVVVVHLALAGQLSEVSLGFGVSRCIVHRYEPLHAEFHRDDRWRVLEAVRFFCADDER